MSEINVQDIVNQMLNAAKKPLENYWGQVKPLAEQQFFQFSINIKKIAEMKLKGEITEEQARLQMNIQQHSIQVVLLTFEGLGILAVENAINAAIGVIRTAVNSAIG